MECGHFWKIGLERRILPSFLSLPFSYYNLGNEEKEEARRRIQDIQGHQGAS